MIRLPARLAVRLLVLAVALAPLMPAAAQSDPPKGFEAIFNGQDLTGWHGLNPHLVVKLPEEKREANRKQQRAEFADHWRVENGELVNDGHGPYATTDQEYGNIELMLEYKTVARADSGIYLRGTPQVQIWDSNQSFDSKRPTRRPELGSGGLFNNSPSAYGRDPLEKADKAFGQWNSVKIRQVGDRTWVWLNGIAVVEAAIMENYWDRSQPLPAMGPLMLQTHGGEIRWRNIFVRQIDDHESESLLAGLADKTPQWTALFNGKDLEGWTPKIRHHAVGENYGDTFRVEDGLLKVRYDSAAYPQFDERFGHLFFNQPFSHYRLRVVYRFVGEQNAGGPGWALRNSGLMLHGESPQTMDIDQDFPASIEVQLLGGNGTDDRTTANLCTPGTNVVKDGTLFTPHCTSSSSQTYAGEQWVTVEVEVNGSDVIRHKVNGQPVLQYTQPQLDKRDPHAAMLAEKQGGILLDKGTISLQSESHPCDFQSVEIMVLDP
ncbi:DUF1080 domain-containing protein [Stieleria sp. TO1_6]|uniref:3-keto-disaccharide hydrolase n=1 Tax=Stieleria tagensis TaxID=2956795 RepID=UPI00209AF4D1|nr:DUF1080 domain-containing protein [Stieleria tagensis]MCO8121071.1 DUF1080 domain-containing protein [Stieleria tagensis]